uniref:CSN8/PSMD8/EIF3K domain-containing protein n=1 Tax=Ditylenchus dipsaci TaxID=166011 RepID=A0A915DAJ5_9BILA
MASAKIEAAHKSLLSEWAKENRNLASVKQKLAQIELELKNPSTLNALNAMAATTIHKDYFEISALYNALSADLNGFQEAIAKVHCFYESQFGESSSNNKYLMYGLHLMYLLATNKLSDFHMLLEQIDQTIQQSNPYISTPVKLEECLMEGPTTKLMEKTIPSPFYAVFIKILMDTVRNEIASCMEKSYERLLVKDASWLEIGQERVRLRQPIKEHPQSAVTIRAQLDTQRITKQNLFYAKQLEMII